MAADLLDRLSVGTGELARRLPGGNAPVPALLQSIRQLEQQEGAQAPPGDAHIRPQELSAASTFLTGNHTVKQEAVVLPGAPPQRRPRQPLELGSGQGARSTRGVLHGDQREVSVRGRRLDHQAEQHHRSQGAKLRPLTPPQHTHPEASSWLELDGCNRDNMSER